MVPSAQIRTQYIKKLMASSKPIRTRRVYYKGKTENLEVYRFDLNYLIFNQYNDRIAVEMKTRLAQVGEAGNEYNEQLENLICNILWEESESRNKGTEENIKRIGQQEPGVITLDGVIIDGNRRAMILKKHLNENWFEAGVIKEELADNRRYIRQLETQIQYGTDDKVDYEPINLYLKIKDFVDIDGLLFPDIARLFNKTEAAIKSELEIMRLMDEYLDYIGAPGIYTLLKFSTKSGSREGSFVDLKSNLNQMANSGKVGWAYSQSDIDDYKRLYFDYIRSECSDPKDFRKLAPAKTKSKGGIFMDETLFKNLVNEHDEAVTNVTFELKTINELAALPENKNKSQVEIAQQREILWRESVDTKNMYERLRKTGSEWDDILNDKKPADYLNDALRKLEKITEADLRNREFLDDFEAQENVKKINTIIYDIKKIMLDRRKTH